MTDQSGVPAGLRLAAGRPEPHDTPRSAQPGRRLAASARAAVVPVAASALALGGLTAWSASGAAGQPSSVEITGARVVMSDGDSFTAAAFRIRNSGDADDELLSVSSPDAGWTRLVRTRAGDNGSSTMKDLATAVVPARTTLAMSSYGVNVLIEPRATLSAGQKMRFVLRFRRKGPVEATAVVSRPGS
jgi:copper(I)-binding protein